MSNELPGGMDENTSTSASTSSWENLKDKVEKDELLLAKWSHIKKNNRDSKTVPSEESKDWREIVKMNQANLTGTTWSVVKLNQKDIEKEQLRNPVESNLYFRGEKKESCCPIKIHEKCYSDSFINYKSMSSLKTSGFIEEEIPSMRFDDDLSKDNLYTNLKENVEKDQLLLTRWSHIKKNQQQKDNADLNTDWSEFKNKNQKEIEAETTWSTIKLDQEKIEDEKRRQGISSKSVMGSQTEDNNWATLKEIVQRDELLLAQWSHIQDINRQKKNSRNSKTFSSPESIDFSEFIKKNQKEIQAGTTWSAVKLNQIEIEKEQLRNPVESNLYFHGEKKESCWPIKIHGKCYSDSFINNKSMSSLKTSGFIEEEIPSMRFDDDLSKDNLYTNLKENVEKDQLLLTRWSHIKKNQQQKENADLNTDWSEFKNNNQEEIEAGTTWSTIKLGQEKIEDEKRRQGISSKSVMGSQTEDNNWATLKEIVQRDELFLAQWSHIQDINRQKKNSRKSKTFSSPESIDFSEFIKKNQKEIQAGTTWSSMKLGQEKIEVEKQRKGITSRSDYGCQTEDNNWATLKENVEKDELFLAQWSYIQDANRQKKNYSDPEIISSIDWLEFMKNNQTETMAATTWSKVKLDQEEIEREKQRVSMHQLQQPDDLNISIETEIAEIVRNIKNIYGYPLRKALAQIIVHQPTDPIDYLAKYLLNYRQHLKNSEDRQKYFDLVALERERIENEAKKQKELSCLE